MAIYRKKKSSGVWYFSVYAGPNRPRLRGSCGTTNRVEAQLIEQTMRVAAGKRAPKEHVLRLIEALYADDAPLKRAHDKLDNPWPLASPMEHKSERREAFTREEVAAIFAAADKIGHDWPVVARLGACTGLRYVDIALLRFEDIKDGAISKKPIKTQRYGIAVCLPLPADVLAMLAAYGTGKGYIFAEHAHYYRTSARMPVGARFSDVLRLAGIDADKYDFHCFRHYFRTQLAAVGVSDETAMRLGGWTQRNTAARYDHDEHREELAAAIESAWTE